MKESHAFPFRESIQFKEGAAMEQSDRRKVKTLPKLEAARLEWKLTEADKNFLRSCNISPQ